MWSTLRKLIWLVKRLAKPIPTVETTVEGESPLILADAVASPLVSLTQYGRCDYLNGTIPSPDAPSYVLCNNGTVFLEDRDLPPSYRRVLGYDCNNNAMWEISNFHLRGSDTVRISFSIDGACNVWGCYQGTEATDNYDLYASTSSGAKYLRYADGTYASYWSSANLGVRFDVVFTPQGTQGMPQDSVWTPRDFESANDMLIGSTTVSGSSSKLKGKLYGDIIVDGRLHLIPCERAVDGVLGWYDTYTNRFFAPYPGYVQAVSLGYDTSHMRWSAGGMVEHITIAPLGNCVQNGTPTPMNRVPVVGTPCGNTELLGIDNDRDSYDPTALKITRRISYKIFDGTEPFGTSSAYGNALYITNPTTAWGADRTKGVLCNYFVGTSPAGGNKPEGTCFFNASGHFYFRTEDYTPTSFKTYLRNRYEQGFPLIVYFVRSTSAEETYTGEYIGWGGGAPSLLSTGSGGFSDTYVITTGILTRYVGVKVFSGTEAVSASGSGWAIAIPDKLRTKSEIVCNYYPYSSATMANAPDKSIISFASQNIGIKDSTFSTASDVQAWLANNLKLGRAMFLLYPLAEPSEERDIAEEPTTTEGDNILTWSAAVNGKRMEATYNMVAPNAVGSAVVGTATAG